MKRVYFLATLLLLLLSSCGKDDLRTYYYPTIEDGKTRYYLYDEKIVEDGEEFSCLSTKRIERIGNSKLIGVEYRHLDDISIPVDSSVMKIDDQGVKIVESYFYLAEEGWVPYQSTKKGYVMRWNWEEGEKEEINWSVPAYDDYPKTILLSERSFAGYGSLSKPVNNHKKYMILKGTKTRKLNGEEHHFDVEIKNLEATGFYSYKLKSKGYEYTMILKKELSKKEYDAQFRSIFLQF